MTKFFLAIPFLLFVFANASSQNNLPPIYETKTDSATYQNLSNNYWQVLEDSSNNLLIQDILQSSGSKFRISQTNQYKIDHSLHTFWIRYRIKNPMPKNANICLDNTTGADISDFFVINQDGQSEKYSTGYLYPWGKKNGLKKLDAIPIVIPSGKEVFVYNRITNSYYFNRPETIFVRIGNTDKIIQENYILNEDELTNETTESSMFAGILLCAFFINLFFYFIVREKLFIYYILFLIYFSFDTYTNFFVSIIFKYHSPVFFYFLEKIIQALGIPLFVYFLRSFLNVLREFPSWDKCLKLISVLSPLVFIIRLLVKPHLSENLNGMVYYLSRFVFDIGLVMILITVLLYLKSPDKLVKQLILSTLPGAAFWASGFSITDLYDFLASAYNVSYPRFINWLNEHFEIINMVVVIWLVISFSRVLILRFLQLRKDNIEKQLEKERLLKEKEIEKGQLIEKQKIELEKTVELRTSELKQSLEHLQSTQSQLIQSEKMASLGELTAGIAHEIQNPLNFVNNFSEVNKELVDELQGELKSGNIEEAMAISNDINENEKKINHHGKRADAIVKGMLQHSRLSTGTHEPTDVNALSNEYLRLSYHGLRAKDNSFNATILTNFDTSIGKINIIPQDIGRVLLNLYNNAFYAVSEKKKQQPDNYEPTVSVSTKRLGDKVEIRVWDNGNGIPHKVVEKIFQPFFTTKPTGQGTGLGLSLSYDIVKAHGGEIKVKSEEGKFSEFIINLPE